MVVNMIPHVIGAEPGLRSMLDLPVPRCILGKYSRADTSQEITDIRKASSSPSKVILPVGERAPQVPDDTKGAARAFTKGFLQEESAKRGDTVTVRTMSDRLVEGLSQGAHISDTYLRRSRPRVDNRSQTSVRAHVRR